MKKLFLTSFAFTGLTLTAWMLGATSCFRTTYNALIDRLDVRAIGHFTDSLYPVILPKELANGDTVLLNDFGMGSQIQMHVFLTSNKPSFGNQVLAFKPAPPQYTLVERIRSIRVITLEDYNQNFPAGADMTSACRFLLNNLYDPVWLDAPVFNDTLPALMAERQDYSSVIIYSKLKEAPADPDQLKQFVTEIETEDGVLFRDTTIRFYIH